MRLRPLMLALSLAGAGALAACNPPEEEKTAETFPDAGTLTQPGAAPAPNPPQQQQPVGSNQVEIHTSGAVPAKETATGSDAGR